MATLKELRDRIEGVQNIQQITRAMKMVAAARLQRAEKAIVSLRPYASRLDSFCARFISEAVGLEHPFFEQREVENHLVLGIASDRGLCGSYNNKVTDETRRVIEKEEADSHHLEVIGTRGALGMRHEGYEPDRVHEDVFNPVEFEFSEELSTCMQEMFLHHEVDRVSVVYSKFYSPVRQEVLCRTLMPCDPGQSWNRMKEEAAGAEDLEGVEKEPDELGTPEDDVYIYEPSYGEVCRDLVHRNITVQLHRCLLEAQASEQGARMIAMDNATDNAEEMVEDLTRKMNRQRQESITRELLDIAAGAEQMRKG